MRQMNKTRIVLLAVSFFFLSFIGSVYAESSPKKWTSQQIYVPIYSHIFASGDARVSIDLSATLVIRNTDADHGITITTLTYYDSTGKLLKQYLTTPLKLDPMASTYFLIRESDTSGGWGANFIVEWSSETPVTEPITEAVFLGTRGSHSYSFTSEGKVLSGK
jgi:ABC-type oligopeptide transport system substrate-binding subunit